MRIVLSSSKIPATEPLRNLVCDVSHKVTDAELDEAGRQAAVSLMRVCEWLEVSDAGLYPDRSERLVRLGVLRHHYKHWYSRVARSVGRGEVAGRPGDDS